MQQYIGPNIFAIQKKKRLLGLNSTFCCYAVLFLLSCFDAVTLWPAVSAFFLFLLGWLVTSCSYGLVIKFCFNGLQHHNLLLS